MASKQPLLPLFFVRKSGFRSSLNEKTLIFLLVISSIFTFILVIRNLPTGRVNEDEIKKIFIPELNDSEAEHKLIHVENKHQHDDIKPLNGVVPEPNLDSHDDSVNQMRREKVKNMTIFAWQSYKQYAWGSNELKPISKSSHTPGIFGFAHNLGASIVDALDTLYIMGLHEEFKEGANWVKDKFSIMINTDLSFFEVNIRFIGGFLAAYTLTQDKLFLDKAVEVADAFLPAFSTATGYSFSLFNPINKLGKNYNWAASQCSILSEFGTLSLEFQYLTDLTGNKIYQEKIEKIYQSLEKANKKEGLYYNYANPHTGSWCNSQASMAGLGDSFYEYLLKYWLLKAKSDPKMLQTYLDAMKAIRSKLVSTSGDYTFLGEYSNGILQAKMGHLACFSGGLFALTAMQNDAAVEERDEFRRLAIEITKTCHESYIRMPTHIGPEAFSFQSGREFDAMDSYYILRPEVIESYFYLWRMTKEQKYRDWAWDAVEAIEKYCRTDSGYSGLRDVRSTSSSKDDVQQSFFFAETLKYLYLIFSEDDVLPLDKYVFNTEAHPFLIKKNK